MTRTEDISRAARTPRNFAALVLLALAFGSARAGSIPIAWDPVPGSDVAGYKIYYGTAPGGYTLSRDVGNVTVYNLTGLTDCTRYYIAAKAYDANGNESSTFSPELSGLSTPTATASAPSSSERGQSLIVTVNGANFGANASVLFSDPKISVLSTTFVSCNQLRASISIAPDAALGSDALEVKNTDGSFGMRAGALQVLDITVPVVNTTVPSAGATGTIQAMQPTITFSEPMDSASVTIATVRLVLSDGTAVAQAAGSPSLDATGRTARIVPAASLQYQTIYRIQVSGAAGGVRDAQGTYLASAFMQSPGFTTVLAPVPPAVSSTSPAAGSTGSVLAVQPSVTLSKSLDPASVTTTTVRLILSDGTAVAQAAGSPSLDATGTIVRIVPASALLYATMYRIHVAGGSGGVRDMAGNHMTASFTQGTAFTTVTAPLPAPAISSATPADGAVRVETNVRPAVTFTKPLDPSSVSVGTVQLLLIDGTPVPQAPGSPSLDAAGLTATITPASPLSSNTTYIVRAVGGSAGVRDLAGTSMTATYTQSAGFLTKPFGPGSVTNLHRKDQH